MFRRPYTGDAKQALGNDQFEFSQAYLTRTRRILFLRGIIVPAVDERGGGRLDVFSAVGVGDDIMAMNVEDPTAPIYLFIDSPGGDVTSGMVLYDIIRMSRAPIITVGVSCASMATVILVAGKERLAFPHSRMMMHLPSGGYSGDVDQIKIRSDLLQDIKNELVDTYIECGVTADCPKIGPKQAFSSSGKTKSQIKKQILGDIDREFWLNAAGSVTYGLVDRIATTDDLFGAEGTTRSGGE